MELPQFAHRRRRSAASQAGATAGKAYWPARPVRHHSVKKRTTETQRHREEKKKREREEILISFSSLSSFLLCASVSLWLVFLYYRIAQHAELFDLDFDHVTVLEKDRRLAREADARRRAGEDEIARLQRYHLRDVGKQIGCPEDHHPCVAVLHDLAIKPKTDGKIM